jgi:hypothetical protein
MQSRHIPDPPLSFQQIGWHRFHIWSWQQSDWSMWHRGNHEDDRTRKKWVITIPACQVSSFWLERLET